MQTPVVTLLVVGSLLGCSSKDEPKTVSSPKVGERVVEEAHGGSAVATGPRLSAASCATITAKLGDSLYVGSPDTAKKVSTFQDECVKEWPVAVETCVGQRGDPWKCLPTEHTFRALVQEPMSHADGCAPFRLQASAWGLSGDNHALALYERWLEDRMVKLCGTQKWSANVQACAEKAAKRADFEKCAQLLTVEQGNAVLAAGDNLVELTKTWPTAKLKSCAEEAAHYYNDTDTAAFKFPRLDGAGRAKLIAEARQLMTAACAAWQPLTRACLDATKTQAEADVCFGAKDSWLGGLPARDSVFATGIPACDRYTALAKKCGKLEPFRESLDKLRNARDYAFDVVKGSPDDKEAAAQCQKHVDEIRC